LRCSFGDSAIVPDVTIFRWNRIPFNPSGRIINRFEIHPDWSIEILSPGQSQTKVLENLLYCSQYGTEIGWLIDPEEESILTIDAQQKIQLLRGDRALPILPEIELSLTVTQVLSWLTFG
jgi:Uma2 family endonuclease